MKQNLPLSFQLFAFSLLAVLAFPVDVWAQTVTPTTPTVSGSTFGYMICNAYRNTGPLYNLIAALFFIAGLYFAIQGIIDFKKTADSPTQNAIHKGVLKLVAAGALVSVPGIAGMLVRTFYTVSSGSGAAVCVPGAVTATGGAGLDVMMKNFVTNVQQPLTLLVLIIGFVLGLFFIGRGLLKAAKFNQDPQKNNITHITANFVVGALILAFVQSVNSWLTTIYGTSALTTYTGVGSVAAAVGDTSTANVAFNDIVKHMLIFVQLIGLIGFLRGWVMVKHAVEGFGQQTIGQGLTHVIGGVIAINIPLFIQIAENTFGGFTI